MKEFFVNVIAVGNIFFSWHRKGVKHNICARPPIFEMLQSKGTSHKLNHSQRHQNKITYFITLFIIMLLNCLYEIIKVNLKVGSSMRETSKSKIFKTLKKPFSFNK